MRVEGSVKSSKFIIVMSDYCSEREKHRGVREACFVRSSVGCEDQPCSWVCREGRQREREKIS
jgi:hypothetical protein